MLKRSRFLAAMMPMPFLFLLGCGEDKIVDGGVGPGDGGPVPFEVFEVALRPLAIQRASESQNLPNPQLAVYYLTAFFKGGQPGPTFEWQLDPVLGTLGPKSEDLGLQDPTVVLLNDGATALGFYDITVSGQSGEDVSVAMARFAVVENSWMKHRRARIGNIQDPPPNLVMWPTFLPGDPERVVYIESPTATTVNMKAIPSYAPLDASEQLPRNVFITPSALSQQLSASELSPDVSPEGLGRNEILFSSQLDINADDRTGRVPFNIWVVKRPEGIVQREPTVVTFDSTFERFGTLQWYAFNYLHPRWDPTATGQSARIGFVTNKSGSNNVWLADLLDRNQDTKSDTLVNARQLTTSGSVSSFSWHPNGEFIYFTRAGTNGIQKINVESGGLELLTFSDQDSLLSEFNYVTVFQRPGESTLVAFQANSENLVNLYVYNEDEDTLTRVLPYPFPVTQNLFPRWHPTRRELLYVGDYSVNAWSDNVDPAPVGNPEFFGQRRTQYPSVWSVRLED